jgi:hypothetical protein
MVGSFLLRFSKSRRVAASQRARNAPVIGPSLSARFGEKQSTRPLVFCLKDAFFSSLFVVLFSVTIIALYFLFRSAFSEIFHFIFASTGEKVQLAREIASRNN